MTVQTFGHKKFMIRTDCTSKMAENGIDKRVSRPAAPEEADCKTDAGVQRTGCERLRADLKSGRKRAAEPTYGTPVQQA